MQSGCVFNSWALHRKHKEVAFKMAKKFGCTKDDPKEIVQFLLSVPAHDLVEYSKLNKLEVRDYLYDKCFVMFTTRYTLNTTEKYYKYLQYKHLLLIINRCPMPYKRRYIINNNNIYYFINIECIFTIDT